MGMKLSKEGVECPLKIGNHYTSGRASFSIDWANCKPKVEKYQDLDGMILILGYKQGENKWTPKRQVHYKKKDNFKAILNGSIQCKLEERKKVQLKFICENYSI